MTLTEASYWTRRFGVIGGGAFLILVIVIVVLANIPEPDLSETVLKPNFRCTETAEEFAQSQLTIPSLQLAAGSTPVYTIQTETGQLDQIPRVANVYAFSEVRPTLGAQNQARRIAERFGMDPEQIIRTNPSEYNWPEDQFGRSLRVDAATLNFSFRMNMRNKTVYPENGTLPSEQEAVQRAKSILRTGGWYFDDYANGLQTEILIRVLADGSFAEAPSRSEADLIRVDFYRNRSFLTVPSTIPDARNIHERLQRDYFGYPSNVRNIQVNGERIELFESEALVRHLDTQKSNITVYIGPKSDNRDFEGPEGLYGLDFTGWIIDTEPCGLYPLISPTQIASSLENSEASLVYLNEKGGDNVVGYRPQSASNFQILSVRVIYMDLPEQQKFLQPVYMIRGEVSLGSGVLGDFIYYVPAIDYSLLRNAVPEEEIVPDAGGGGLF